MPDRTLARRALLSRAGWGDATAVFLAGDASDRTYDRLIHAGQTAVLMDAPPGKGDDPTAFLAVALHLLDLNLSAPRLIAKDTAQGFLLLEDFGDAVFARVLLAHPDLEPTLYATAIDALVRLQSNPPMPGLNALSAVDWANAAALALTQYRAAVAHDAVDETSLVSCIATLIDEVAAPDPVMILRDFHAENLIWLPQRTGAARAGLLDFQLAQMGHPVYDVISLLQDARRDVRPLTVHQMRNQFCEATGLSEQAYEKAAAVWGAQRALRILGIFTRLAMQSGKTGYLSLMPRIWGHLQTNLAHPSLSDLRDICTSLLPAPSPAVLATIRRQSGG